MSHAHRKMHRRWARHRKYPTLSAEEIQCITEVMNHRNPGDVGYRWVKRRRQFTHWDDKRYQRVVWRDPRPKPEPRVVILDRVAMPTFLMMTRKRHA